MMSNRLRLWVDRTSGQIPILDCLLQFISYKKERVNERLALFLCQSQEGLRLSQHPRCRRNTSSRCDRVVSQLL